MKEIRFIYKGQEYLLGFTRNTAKIIEENGLRLEDISEKPLNSWPMLFRGAFLKNHRAISSQLVDEMFADTKDIKGLINALTDLYVANYNTLIDPSVEEESAKNGHWEIS